MGSGKKLRTILLFFVDMFAVFLAYSFSFFVKYEELEKIWTREVFTKHIVFIIALYIIPLTL